MTWLTPQRITERTVLRILVSGFTLVVALLGAAGLIAIRDTSDIESNTASVGREQLQVARLLGELHTRQSTLAAVLHQVTDEPESVNLDEILRDLTAADEDLRQTVKAAASTEEAAHWQDLQATALAFSASVRAAVQQKGPLSAADAAKLFEQHDAVDDLSKRILQASSKRVADTEARIEAESRELGGQSSVLLGACLLLAVACASLTVFFARRSIRHIEWQAGELSRVSWHMLQSQEETARRFSHELHDELGQSLAAVKSSLTSGKPEDLAARRADCVHLVDEAIANVRELSQLLRPVILDDFGLDAGLRWLAEGFTQRTGIQVSYESGLSNRLSDETETHLFRIAQEALTNVARHSGANRVRLELTDDAGHVTLVIADNGRGLSPVKPSAAPSLGLTGMRARARQAGGDLSLSTPSGGGLRVDVRVPATPDHQNVHKQRQQQEDPYPVG